MAESVTQGGMFGKGIFLPAACASPHYILAAAILAIVCPSHCTSSMPIWRM
jgi:hypothetical protein